LPLFGLSAKSYSGINTLKLSIVVPVYNEERHLEPVIETLMKSACPIEREWIFVDDSSRDQSLAILKKLARLQIPSSH